MNKREVYEILKDKGFVTLYRVVSDDKHTMAHYLIENNGTEKVRIEFYDNKTKEFINGLEDVYYGASEINGRTQLSGETRVDMSEHEKTTIGAIAFHEEYMMTPETERKHDMEHYISAERYYQHNVANGIGDGREATIESTKDSELKYDKCLIRIISGDFLAMMNQQYWLNPKTNEVETWEFTDIIRYKDGLAIEHWDIIKRKLND